MIDLAGGNPHIQNLMCFTANCGVAQYNVYPNGNYSYCITFEKYPFIRVETGKKGDEFYTQVIEENVEDVNPESKLLYQFDKEMTDITLDRLQTILTFG